MKKAFLVAAAVLVGCSSSSSGGAGNADAGADGTTGNPDSAIDAAGDGATPVPADIAAACNALATAICTELQTCSMFGLGVDYGDLGTCEARFAIGCDASLQAPGTGATVANTNACAQSFSQVTCASFFAGDYGAACAPPAGTITGTGACGDDAQCQSGFCAISPTSQCGTCAPPTTPDGGCVNMVCSQGMTCNSGATTCAGPGKGQVGDTCAVQSDCDLAHAIGCNTSSGKCFTLTLSTVGSMCGAASIMPTSYALCPASGACSGVLNGVCSAAAADGMPCGTASAGPSCMPPAKCVAGTCTLPNPSSCH